MFDVDAAPPTIAARDAASAPSAAARRIPNSSTGRPRAASTTRAALVAISVAKLSWLSSGVSSSWAAASGPSTTVIGVFGWTTRPSATASRRSPAKSSEPNQAQEGVVEQPAAGAGAVAAERLDVGRGRPASTSPSSANGARPAATQ